MKMKKQICSCLLIALMLFSTSVTAFAKNNEVTFSDVPNNIPYISELVQAGIIKGYDNGLFGFNDICTRAQYVTLLHRMAGTPEASKKAEFNDIVPKAYYEEALNWAAENFIVTGFEDGSFGVDKKMDKAHALTFLHRFATVTKLGEYEKRAMLSPYEDEKDIDLYAREAFAWALADDIIDKNIKALSPKEDATRDFCASVIWKLLTEHHHNNSEYIDNKDGTHSLKCELYDTHNITEEHSWNDGDLIKKPTDKKDGEILKTCKICLAQKKEVAKAGTEILTRADLEKAVVDTAWYYYMKGTDVQYDSTYLTPISPARYGNYRLTNQLPPEFATDDMTLFSVCSAFTYTAWLEALNMHTITDLYSAGVTTTYQWRVADNQQYETYAETGNINQPTTEDDRDMAILRWVDWDKYEAQYASRIKSDVAFSVFSSSSFTDFTDEEIRFVNDGFDGTIHYSYYDKEGNKLDPDSQIKKQIIKAFMEDYEKNLRPGDVLVPKGHAVLYIGNNEILHCNGGKINLETGVDKVENSEDGEIGAIFNNIPDAYTATAFTDTHYTHIRPLDGIIDEGYDEDLGNDIVEIKIPEKTLSRMKYPAMEINRVVDASPYGTVTKNDELTYTIEITNKTNNPYFKKWTGKTGGEAYKNLTVTEKIPENAEFVEGSIIGGGKFKDGTISWKIDKIAPGEKITLNYKVKAIGEIGEKIVNDGGFVDNIPSNSITNVIGNEKLSDEQKSELSKISSNGTDGLKEFGTDSDFAKNIYKKAGKEIDIPAITDITKELFPAEDFIADKTYSEYFAPDLNPIRMYIPRKDVADGYKTVKSMLINDYWGGYRFFIGEERKAELGYQTIKDFKTNYLEAGDILVYLTAKDRENATMSNEFSKITVMVYDGENLLSSTKSENGEEFAIYNKDEVKQTMLNAIMNDKDLFFALRPSQAK